MICTPEKSSMSAKEIQKGIYEETVEATADRPALIGIYTTINGVKYRRGYTRGDGEEERRRAAIQSTALLIETGWFADDSIKEQYPGNMRCAYCGNNPKTMIALGVPCVCREESHPTSNA